MEEFAVVKFIGQNDGTTDESVSEVPSKWLVDDNTFCWWPPTRNASTFISKGAIPNVGTWKKYRVAVECYCKSLSSARKKADDINYTSSEEFNHGKSRKIIPKKCFYEDFNHSSTDESESSKIIPKKKLKKSLTPPPVLNEVDDDTTIVDIATIPVIVVENSLSNENALQPDQSIFTTVDEEYIINHPDADLTSVGSANSESVNSGAVFSRTSTPNMFSRAGSSTASTSSKFVYVDSSLLRKILDTVNEIKLQIKDLHNNVVCNGGNVSTIDTLDAVRKFVPIKRLDDLKKFEEFLTEEGNVTLFKKFINIIGGNGPKENISRIFKKIYSDEFAVLCSWLGHRNNIRMCDRLSMGLIKGVVLNSFTMREKDFETFSAEWFRHAKQRLNRKQLITISELDLPTTPTTILPDDS